MEITRTSQYTGRTHTMDLDVTEEQMTRYAQKDGLVQHIFPNLNPDEREFIMTGCTPQEWTDMFGDDED